MTACTSSFMYYSSRQTYTYTGTLFQSFFFFFFNSWPCVFSTEEEWMWLLGIEYIKYIIYKIIGLPSSRHCWCSPTPSSSFLGLQETSVSSPYGCVRSVTGACQWNTSRRRDRTCRFSCLCSPPWHPVALRVGTKLWNGLKGFSRSACLHLFVLPVSCLAFCLTLPETPRKH